MQFWNLSNDYQLKKAEKAEKLSRQKKWLWKTLSNILNLNWQDLENLKDFSVEDLAIIWTIFPQKTEQAKYIIKSKKLPKTFYKNLLKKYWFLASCILEEFKIIHNNIDVCFELLDSLSSHSKQISMKEFAWKLMWKKNISIAQYKNLYDWIQNFYNEIVLWLIKKLKKDNDIIKLYKKVKGYEKEIFEAKILWIAKPNKEILYLVINNFDRSYKSKAFDLFKKLYPKDMFELAEKCEILTFQAIWQYNLNQIIPQKNFLLTWHRTASLGNNWKNGRLNDIDRKYKFIVNSNTYRNIKWNELFQMPLIYMQKAICEIDDEKFTNKVFEKIQETAKDEDYIKALKYIINNSKRYKKPAGILLLNDYQSYEDLIFVAKNFPELKEKAYELMVVKYSNIEALTFIIRNSEQFGEEACELLLELCEKDWELSKKDKKQSLYLIMKSYNKYYQRAIELLIFFMDDNELLQYLLDRKEWNSIVWEKLKQTKLTSQQLGEIIQKYWKYSNISKQSFEILKDNEYDNIETLKEIIKKQSYHKQQCIEVILWNDYINPEDILRLVDNVPMYIGIIWDKIEKSQKLITDKILLEIFKKLSKVLNEEKKIEEDYENQTTQDKSIKQSKKTKQLQQEIYRLERTTTFYVIENYNLTSDLVLEIAISKDINNDIKHTICGNFIEQTIKKMQQLRKQLDLSKFKNIRLEVNIDMELFAKIFKCVKTLKNNLEEFCWQFCIWEDEIVNWKKGITETEFKSMIKNLTLKSIMK